jgi:hypothetical protein
MMRLVEVEVVVPWHMSIILPRLLENLLPSLLALEEEAEVLEVEMVPQVEIVL